MSEPGTSKRVAGGGTTRGERTLREMLPHGAACVGYGVHARLTTLVSRLLAWWWLVELGPRVAFRGLPILRRHPRSLVRIGAGSVLCSRTEYNLIGINRPCILATLKEGARIEIGAECGFSGTVLGAELSITLGNRVRCGANTLITDTDWHTDDTRTTPPRPVVIEDDVWLGANVTVLKGVTIGANSLIGTGSLVRSDIPPNAMAAGVPARVIRPLRPDSPSSNVS